jgi:hypothetical protein
MQKFSGKQRGGQHHNRCRQNTADAAVPRPEATSVPGSSRNVNGAIRLVP